MAGKIQLAAKYLLGTTLLASGTGGVYYGTTHGWSLPGANQAAKQSASDLDAVTSAWAEPTSKQSPDSQSSPVARSAAASPARADEPVVKPATDDRYAKLVELPTPAVVAKNDVTKDAKVVDKEEKKQKNELKPAKSDDSASVKVASNTEDTKSDSDDDEPSPTPATPATPTPEKSITRGQEPKDDVPPAAVQVKDTTPDISGAFDAAPKNSALPKEPKPLNMPAQQTNIGDAATRAKQAFGNTNPPGPNDRYGDALLPAPPAAAAPKSAAINPFGPAPVAASPVSGKGDRIEPLPTQSNDVSGSLRELQPAGDGMRPLDTGHTATRTTNHDFGSKSPHANGEVAKR